jgi:uncharacterized membrane protein YphA (DoxX/SURF4 family)
MKGQLERYFQVGIHRTTRLVLGGVFIYAGVLKMRSPQDFADSLASYRLVPYPIVNLWAMGLPLFELLCGLFLLTKYFCRIGLLSIMSLLIIFLGAILSAELRRVPISCGCFGTRSWLDANLWVSISRDLALLLGAVFAYRHYLRRGT